MSVVTMTFNGVDLSDKLIIHDIQRDIGNPRQISTDASPFLGVNVQGIRHDPKIIRVSFSLWARDRNSLKRELAGIFLVNEPKRLTFSDEPDKYYLAVVEGDIGMQEGEGYRSSGDITFLIPDGVAHSHTYSRFDNPRRVGKKLVFDVVNHGTVPAYPIVTVKHNSENGYVGLVNPLGAFEAGNPQATTKTVEVAQKTVTQVVNRSEYVFDYRNKPQEAISRGAGTGLVVTSDGVSTAQSVSRGRLLYQLPNASSGGLNEYFYWYQIYYSAHSSSAGTVAVSFEDEAGRFLYGVETKDSTGYWNAVFAFYVTDGKGGKHLVKSWPMTHHFNIYYNPFGSMNGKKGSPMELKRRDDKVTVFFWGKYYDFTLPSLAGRRTARVEVALVEPGGFRMEHMAVRDMYYRKDAHKTVTETTVTKVKEIPVPNPYPKGMVLTINSETDQLLVDGLPKLSEMVNGSQFLAIPPGESQLECQFSSFVETLPSVTVSFEERWL